MGKYFKLQIMLACCFICSQSIASETFIEKVKVEKGSQGKYRISVTLAHADKSWDHYADFWQVETVSGDVLAKRVLHHPHINEQPFTRSLFPVTIAKGVRQIVITAGCTVDGKNSEKHLVNL